MAPKLIHVVEYLIGIYAFYYVIKMTACGRDSVFGRPWPRRRIVMRPSTPRLDTSRSPCPGPG